MKIVVPRVAFDGKSIDAEVILPHLFAVIQIYFEFNFFGLEAHEGEVFPHDVDQNRRNFHYGV